MTLLSSLPTASPPGALLAAAPSPVTDVAFLREYAETRRYLSGRAALVKVTPDGKSALFVRGGPKDPRLSLFELDLASGETRELLTPEAVLNGAAEVLTAAEKARLERARITSRGFTNYQLSVDGSKILLGLSGKLYVVTRADKKVLQLKTGEGACIDPKFSPDGKSVAYVRENDVRIIELAKNVERAVTTGGTELKPHGLAEFVAQEEMDRFDGFWFSPDSSFIAYQETDHTGVEVFSVADPMHPEKPGDQFFYPRAGKTNATVRLHVVKTTGGKPTEVKWDSKHFPYLNRVRWNAGPLSLQVMNREQTETQFLRGDEKTGKTTVLAEEKDPIWLNLHLGLPFWAGADIGFFWLTERNGGVEIELRKPDGSVSGTWVKPDMGFGDLAGFDAKTKTLFFTGGADPTKRRLFAVTEGGAPRELPVGEDLIIAAELTGASQFLAVTSTSLSKMPVVVVSKADGTGVVPVPSVALEPSLKLSMTIEQLPNDGMWTAVIRPSSFDAKKKYPVILQVYAGPHRQEVTRNLRENLTLQWLANQGFIVVKADGRGTPRRTSAWERGIAKDAAIPGADDQLAALAALGKKYPELDLTRVGTYGWSYGGYMAGYLTLARGEQIKSGVAGAPVVDWLDYDTFYTERYLGLPDAPGSKAYERSSLLSYVKDAKRPLLLIHGTADDNVYFLHTLKLSDAMFRAGKAHSVLPLINFTHLVTDPNVNEQLYTRIAQWFKETL
ncbi:MAG: DPP IV N-terminal domain-containing protein [Archangium sp.]|nr:DPP IV N-terminal domain-containing protein [Archangium sp.]